MTVCTLTGGGDGTNVRVHQCLQTINSLKLHGNPLCRISCANPVYRHELAMLPARMIIVRKTWKRPQEVRCEPCMDGD